MGPRTAASVQTGGDPVAAQPAVHPRPQAGGHLLQQLRELQGTEPAQIPHIDMPEGLGLPNQACPGARVLPALHVGLRAEASGLVPPGC